MTKKGKKMGYMIENEPSNVNRQEFDTEYDEDGKVTEERGIE